MDFVARDPCAEPCPLPNASADFVLLSHVLHMEGPEQNAGLSIRLCSRSPFLVEGRRAG